MGRSRTSRRERRQVGRGPGEPRTLPGIQTKRAGSVLVLELISGYLSWEPLVCRYAGHGLLVPRCRGAEGKAGSFSLAGL